MQIEGFGGNKADSFKLAPLLFQADEIEHGRVIMRAVIDDRVFRQAQIVFAEAAVVSNAQSGPIGETRRPTSSFSGFQEASKWGSSMQELWSALF